MFRLVERKKNMAAWNKHTIKLLKINQLRATPLDLAYAYLYWEVLCNSLTFDNLLPLRKGIEVELFKTWLAVSLLPMSIKCERHGPVV